MQKGEIVFKTDEQPTWVQFVCAEEEKTKTVYSSINEVREKYRLLNKKTE